MITLCISGAICICQAKGFDLGYVGIKQDFPSLNCVCLLKRRILAGVNGGEGAGAVWGLESVKQGTC